MSHPLLHRARALLQPIRSPLTRYALALAIVAIAVALRMLVDPVMGKHSFVLFVAGIIGSAWVGGIGPAILCLVLLHLVHAYWFEVPHHLWEANTASIATTIAYYVVGIAIGTLSHLRASALRRAQDQQRDAASQREHLRTTLSCMADGVLVTDVHGRVMLMNPAAEAMTGWNLNDSKNKPWWQVFDIRPDDGPADAESPVDRVLHDAQIVQEHRPLVLTSSTGHKRPIAYSAAPVRDPEGKTTGVVLIFRDESERRRTELALKNADRRKDEFLATLAHELRNPLAPISMGLDLLDVSADDPTAAAEIRAMMKRQTQHMVRLIDDLLDISRITCGKLELRKTQLQLADIVRDAVEATRSVFQESSHQLTVRVPERPVFVYADANRLTQVFVNLLNNAAKYTPREGRVELRAHQQGSDVVITVSDSGIGIPADKIDCVFDMFAQVNDRHGFGQSGLGIGLALVKRVVEMHGGAVEVQSHGRNLGTTFRVRVPVLAVPPLERTDTRHNRSLPHVAAKRRILVVDDNVDALESLSRMVSLMGNDVRQARDGWEALEVARAFQPDIVLMDLGMPNLDGYDAARRIRQEEWGRDLALVATTGWGQEEDRRRSAEAGFDRHLVKPVELADLRELLEAPAFARAAASVAP